MPLEKHETKRPLTITDLVKGNEFTIAQVTHVDRPERKPFILKVGDVIKIEDLDSEDCDISVNGHMRRKWGRLRVPLTEIGDLIVENPE